jgi:hypothetical protein
MYRRPCGPMPLCWRTAEVEIVYYRPYRKGYGKSGNDGIKGIVFRQLEGYERHGSDGGCGR